MSFISASSRGLEQIFNTHDLAHWVSKYKVCGWSAPSCIFSVKYHIYIHRWRDGGPHADWPILSQSLRLPFHQAYIYPSYWDLIRCKSHYGDHPQSYAAHIVLIQLTRQMKWPPISTSHLRPHLNLNSLRQFGGWHWKSAYKISRCLPRLYCKMSLGVDLGLLIRVLRNELILSLKSYTSRIMLSKFETDGIYRPGVYEFSNNIRWDHTVGLKKLILCSRQRIRRSNSQLLSFHNSELN